MATDDENKDKPYDEISELLKKYYKPSKEVKSDEFWKSVSQKIDSLFHKEITSEKCFDGEGNLLPEEARYWLGLEEYINNQTSSVKHKTITEHLLRCKECRQNYNNLLDKKKLVYSTTVEILNKNLILH